MGAIYTDFDAGYCTKPVVPIPDPVFPMIQTKVFNYTDDDFMIMPQSWINETIQSRGLN